MTCDICSGDHRVGLSGTVRLGGRTSPAVAIGAELSLWREHQDGVTQSLSALGAVVYWRPTVRRPLYLKGGAGLVTHRADDGTDIVTSTGVGPIFGIGYDLRAGRRWVLGPYFSAAIGVIGGGVKFNGGTVTKQVTVSFFQLGVSLTRP